MNYKEDFFEKPAFLTVSGQLNVENFACAVGDSYTFGPTFRAEKSHTSRHLAEFWMIEPELSFATFEDNICCAEEYLKFCLKYVLENNKADLEFFDERVEKGLIQRLNDVISNEFKRLTYTEAIELLLSEVKEKKLKVDKKKGESLDWGVDLGTKFERHLTEQVFKKPVVVTDYPKGIKAFYMR